MLSNYQNACHNAISLFTKDLYVSSCLWARAHSHKNSADTHIQRILKSRIFALAGKDISCMIKER